MKKEETMIGLVIEFSRDKREAAGESSFNGKSSRQLLNPTRSSFLTLDFPTYILFSSITLWKKRYKVSLSIRRLRAVNDESLKVLEGALFSGDDRLLFFLSIHSVLLHISFHTSGTPKIGFEIIMCLEQIDGDLCRCVAFLFIFLWFILSKRYRPKKQPQRTDL